MDVLCLIVFNLCDQQISIVKHFSVDLIEFEFGNKEEVEFQWFYISNMNEILK